MPKGAKLKVYSTSIGFYDALVAAPSQKAALKAWATTTDLFGAGRASVVDAPDLQAEALARPGEVIRRSHGDAAKLIAEMEAEDAAETSRLSPPVRTAKPTPRPVPDRSVLDASERALADAERELQDELDRFAAERADLDAREHAARDAGERRVSELERDRSRTRVTYDQAVARAARK